MTETEEPLDDLLATWTSGGETKQVIVHVGDYDSFEEAVVAFTAKVTALRAQFPPD